jgi:hypothetical protein
MGLTAYGKFQKLRKAKHQCRAMGFCGSTKGINHLNSRMRVARSFRGIQLDDFTKQTIQGYNGLFQVFLTHSAVERYCAEVFGDKYFKLQEIMAPYDPQPVVATFINLDHKQRFYSFLCEHVDVKLRVRLDAVLRGENINVAILSAAIRHLFVHGHLAAHTNGASPAKIYAMCKVVSDFLLGFVDQEFSAKVEAYCTAVGFESV